MTAVATAFRAELAAVLGDRQVRMIVLLALVIYALIYPLPYRAELLRDVPVVLVDQDGSTASADLARRVDASEAVALTHRAPDMAEATRLVHERRAYGVMLIPDGFERALLRGDQSPVALYADASYFLMYQRVMQGAAVPLRQMGAEIEAGRLIAQGTPRAVATAQVSPANQIKVPLFNPAAGYATYVLPAAFVLILQQTMLMGLALAATRRGPLPGHPVWQLMGRAGAWLAIWAGLLPLYLIVLPVLYGLPILGNPGALMMLGLPFLLATGLLAQLVAALFRRGEVVQVVLLALGLPFFFLSGFAWPVEAIPAHLNAVAQLIPSTAAIDGLVRVAQMGATLPEIAQILWHLWALTALLGGAVLIVEALVLRETTPRAAQKGAAEGLLGNRGSQPSE